MSKIGTATVLSNRGAQHGLAPAPRKRRKDEVRMTEWEFAKLIIDFAHLHGWRVAHFRPARVMRKGVEKYETPVGADGKGWPDLVLFRGEDVIAMELKVGSNKPSEEQQEWLRVFEAAHIGAYVFYPRDWSEIERLLSDKVNGTPQP